MEHNTFSENSLSLSFFSSVIYFTKALLCLDVSHRDQLDRLTRLSLFEEWPHQKNTSWWRNVVNRISIDHSTGSRSKRFDLHEGGGDLLEFDDECLCQMENVRRMLRFVFVWMTENSSGKTQTPLTILPTFMKLSGRILTPEYVSIYVKYCYLDTLLLLVQTFIEWTPGQCR